MSAIGDVVHVLPVVASIRAAVPEAHISWIVQRTPHELIRNHAAVDEFILSERRPLVRSLADLRRRVRDRRFDLVLAVQTSLKAGFATSFLKAPRKVGYDRARAPELNGLFTNEKIRPRPRSHVQEEMLEFVDHLGLPRVLKWGLEPTVEERRQYGPLLTPFDGPTIAIVVGSSLAAKDWPVDRWVRLIEEGGVRFGARFVIVGGRTEAELSAAAGIQRLATRTVLDLGAWDLRRLAFLLHAADVVVSPDSGPMHIAVALGTPTVALMGYTNPKRFGPVRFLDLMVDGFGEPGEVYDAAARPRPGRMAGISVDRVMDRVEAALRAPRLSSGGS